MLNRFLFAPLAVLLLFEVCRGEEPDNITPDSVAFKYVALPGIQSRYLEEVSLPDGLPVLMFRAAGDVSVTYPSRFRSMHVGNTSDILRLGTAAVESPIGSPGEARFFDSGNGAAGRVALFKDGIPLDDELEGTYDISLISKISLDMIESMAGPGSSVYGPSCSGGAVSLASKVFKGSAPYSRVAASGGNNGFSEAELEFGRGFGQFWSGYMTADRREGEGTGPGGAFDVKSFSGDLSRRFGSTRAGISVYRLDSKAGAREARREEKRLLLGNVYLKSRTLDAGFYFKDLWKRDDDSLGAPLGTRTVLNGGGHIRKAFETGRHRLVLAAVGRERHVEAGDTFDCEVMDGGLAASADLEVLPLVWLSPSVSYWQDETYGSEVSPRLSASVAYDLGLVFFASVARGFDAPSPGELFSASSGNSGLKPEHVWSYSAGARYEKRTLSISAKGFASETTDLIETVDDSTGRQANSDERRRVSGVSLGTKSELLWFFAGLNLRVLASEQTGTIDRAPYTPGVRAAGYMGYHGAFRKGNLGVSLVLDGEHTGERLTEDGATLAPYSLANLTAEIRVVDVRLFYRIEDLFKEDSDRTYRYGLDWEFWN